MSFLFLVRGDHDNDRLIAKELGTKLMEQGHTVFLSDTDEDLEFFGDVVDGYVEIAPADGVPTAVLYDVSDRRRPGRDALRERAVLPLPAADGDLHTFANNLLDGSML